MKRGQKVFVCYDGKWGRRVVGEIIGTKYDRIQVCFPEWASEDNATLTHWFHKRKRSRFFGGPLNCYAGFVPVKNSLMGNLFGMPGDWYCVYKYKERHK